MKTQQNHSDTLKAVLRGKFIVLSAYIKESVKAQISGLMMHLKYLKHLPATPLSTHL